MEKPDVDEIDGIAPAVAIRQKNTSAIRARPSPLPPNATTFCACCFARVGQTFCPNCGTRVRKDTVDEVAARMLARAARARAGTRCFPCGEHATHEALRDHLFELRKKGFNRLFQGGRLFEFSTPESLLDIDFSKPLFVLVDRIAIGPDLHQRLVDTIEICYREAGEVIFENAAGRRAPALQREVRVQDVRHGVQRARADSVQLQLARSAPARAARASATPSTSTWTASSPTRRFRSTKARWIPGPSRSIARGWPTSQSMPRAKCRFDVPFCDLTEDEREIGWTTSSAGFFDSPRDQEVQAARARLPEPLPRLCAVSRCKGARLRKEALYVRVGGKNLGDVVQHEYRRGAAFFEALRTDARRSRDRGQDPGGDPAAAEISERRRAGLSDARPAVGHAFGRRGAAHPARHLPGLAAGGRVLCAGRAFDRTAHAATPAA